VRHTVFRPFLVITMQKVSPTPVRRLFRFEAGATGPWIIERVTCLAGDPLAAAARLAVQANQAELAGVAWSLRGITSNERYVERHEKAALLGRQEGLDRPASTCAALIPIRKTAAWWALPQDERREIFEAQSRHIGIGMRYLPAVARRLHHCRDLSPTEPFDFLTWFEYAPGDAAAFDELLQALRMSPEWAYVDREIDLRLVRA
jgi:chlorite dismutase